MLRSMIFSLMIAVGCFLPNVANGQLETLSTEDKKYLSKEFRLYNKPAVKIIKTVHGERYNCVDFYKQPAFDHPLLKNHTYTYKVELASIGTNNKNASNTLFNGLWANGEGCPTGTVPLRRYSKKEFYHAKLFQKQMMLRQIMATEDYPGISGQFNAVIRTKPSKKGKYSGCSGQISVYNLPVTGSQYTASYLAVKAQDHTLQAGWMVNHLLYKDGNTRFFLITKIGTEYCFNTMCPGFVVTNSVIPIDSTLGPVSQRGSDTFDFKFTIVKDLVRQEWQLQFKDTKFGFWPKSIFQGQGLGGLAEQAEWGGEAYSPVIANGPGMGSGFFPSGDIKNDGYISDISPYDEKGNVAHYEEFETYTDYEDFYKVIDHKYPNNMQGHLITFGGPGPK